jgi:uncharacterized protein YndB with AHSA1/START domain
MMTAKDFSTTIKVDQSPEEVFNAINDVRGWWSEDIVGGTSKLNDEFKYSYKDVHRCKIRLIEVVPGKKVVWLVLENHFSFTKDKTEWVNTKLSFEISKEDNKTKLVFRHIGLVPDYECFNVCNEAWTNYINVSLRNLIATGKGIPNLKEGGYNGELSTKFMLEG